MTYRYAQPAKISRRLTGGRGKKEKNSSGQANRVAYPAKKKHRVAQVVTPRLTYPENEFFFSKDSCRVGQMLIPASATRRPQNKDAVLGTSGQGMWGVQPNIPGERSHDKQKDVVGNISRQSGQVKNSNLPTQPASRLAKSEFVSEKTSILPTVYKPFI